VDYRRNSSRTVAAWRFRSERKSKVSANRGLDSHSDRNRYHTCCIELSWSYKLLKQLTRTFLGFVSDRVLWLPVVPREFYDLP
jgi:hypothetical protein